MSINGRKTVTSFIIFWQDFFGSKDSQIRNECWQLFNKNSKRTNEMQEKRFVTESFLIQDKLEY